MDLRQLPRWYRTLDHLLLNKATIEVALYQRLRTLFDFQPDRVMYDLTSTHFEGHGPALAKSGYSRDRKPRNVQVMVGVVNASRVFGVSLDKSAVYWNSLCPWLNQPKNEIVGNSYSRQTVQMVWQGAIAPPQRAARRLGPDEGPALHSVGNGAPPDPRARIRR